MSKAKTKANIKSPEKADKPDTGDGVLIRWCMEYAQAVIGVRAAFAADPDPNSKHAEVQDVRLSRRAHKAMLEIAGVKAATPMAVNAKARAVLIYVQEQWASHELDAADYEFMSSFAKDVAALTSKDGQVAGDIPVAPSMPAVQS